MGRNKRRQGLRLTHYVSLREFDRLERHFVTFAARAARHHEAVQSVVVCSRKIHRRHRDLLPNFEDWRYEKKLLGFGTGRQSNPVSRTRDRWLGRRLKPDIALLWNQLGQQKDIIDALGARRCLYWEHGGAWSGVLDNPRASTLHELPAVLCGSHAARRMLQLRHGYDGVVHVCANGLRAQNKTNDFKRLRQGSRLHLGVAGELAAPAGTCVALHVIASLRARGIDASMSIAGDGPLKAQLEQLAASLGIGAQVLFLGVVEDMSMFFADIDLLLHPALSDPDGGVVAEAGAMGCPVVCAAVDALPEVVCHERTGLCVQPTADMARYQRLGGETEGVPPLVYKPYRDGVEAPEVCEPETLVEAVIEITRSAERFSAMSDNAMKLIADRFDFDRHVEDVIGAVRTYHDTGTLAVPE